MKASLLMMVVLAGVAASACAQALDSLPLPAGTRALLHGEDAVLPAATASRPQADAATAPAATATRNAAAAARTSRPAARAHPAATAGGSTSDTMPAPGPADRAAAQPLRVRPVLSWQSLLPGSIQ